MTLLTGQVRVDARLAYGSSINDALKVHCVRILTSNLFCFLQTLPGSVNLM